MKAEKGGEKEVLTEEDKKERPKAEGRIEKDTGKKKTYIKTDKTNKKGEY